MGSRIPRRCFQVQLKRGVSDLCPVWKKGHQVFVKMAHRNSSVLTHSPTPRRSPRFLPLQNHNTPEPKSKSKSVKRSVSTLKSNKCAVGSRRSPRLNNVDVGFLSLRRSPRFNNVPGNKQSKATIVKGHEAKTKENRVVPDDGSTGRRKEERNDKKVDLEMQDNLVVSDKEFGGVRTKEKVEVETQKISVVSDEGFGGGREKGGNREKRKRGGKEIGTGWTREQQLALERAYFTTMPSPRFWKNVSKQVPGKSQQECFDRIYGDFMTPPQRQRRSRAKTLKSSPISQFSISASKLLKPIDKAVRRSNVLKPKNIITQKSVEKLLQRNLKGNLNHEGDIFSVLEPNVDFSTNVSHPSEAISTPKQQKENKGFLLTFTETSSSSRKKPPSRFSGSCVTDLVSPPVLKKVKNRVMHEKYISQLRCRESRRREASTKITGERSCIQKKDAVKAAKVALASEARDAINKFKESQANFMDNTCTSDEEKDDGIEYEDESQ